MRSASISRAAAARLALLVLLFSLPTARALDFAAGEKPFSEASPDGKWLFEANWCGGHYIHGGYLSDIKEVITSRVAFADEKPRDLDHELLPQRMFIQWSPDSRYIIVTYYYGRIVSGDVLLALNKGHWVGVSIPGPGHPRHMIHPKDRGPWIDGSEIKVTLGPWGDKDTLTETDTMDATLLAGDGSKDKIESTRDRIIQLTGTKAKVIETGDPTY